MRRFVFCLMILTVLPLAGVFAQTKSVYSDFPDYELKTKITGDEKFDFLELYSERKKSTRLVCVNKNKPSEYSVLFENRAKQDYSFTAMFYSKKSDTLYFHIVASPAPVNNYVVYYDAGLYAFSRKNGIFSKDDCKRYYVPEKWIFDFVKDAYLKKGDYAGFVDFVCAISDSCEKKLCVSDDDGKLLYDENAAEYIWKNKLYSSDSFAFLNKYLRRVEKGAVTEKSAFTLNGCPELKDSVCKDTLNVANFVQSDDGIWFINEKAGPVEKTDENGNKYTKWEMQYLSPYLLEDKNGNLVRQQHESIKQFKICPIISESDVVDKGFSVYNGWLLMRDMDGQTFYAYKNGEFISKPDYSQMVSFLSELNKTVEKIEPKVEKTPAPQVIQKSQEPVESEKVTLLPAPVESEPVISSQESLISESQIEASEQTNIPSSINTWFFISIILFILLTAAIVIIITLRSKKYEQHLNKKDKRLIFTIQNNERTKISRDLHDSVVQTVRAIRTDVEMLKVQPEDAIKQQQIIKEITDSVVLLRNICYNLSPAEISVAENSDGKGGTTNHLELLSVIDTLCKQFSQKTKIPCTINTDTNFYIPIFTLEVSKYVIRVIQEILTNIEKHSFATSVSILISNEQLEENEMLKIVVIDDGIGCEQSEMTKNKHHFGVRNIIENINLAGGKVEFYTKPNEGMNIVLKVPCSRALKEDSSK